MTSVGSNPPTVEESDRRDKAEGKNGRDAHLQCSFTGGGQFALVNGLFVSVPYNLNDW